MAKKHIIGLDSGTPDSTPISYWENLEAQSPIEKLSSKFEKASKYNPTEHKDKTRSKVAFWFTIGYFALLAVALVGSPLYNAILLINYGVTNPEVLLPVKDVLLTIAGIVGGPIGFVVGYYFKGSEK